MRDEALEAIGEGTAMVCISAASVWEAEIKTASGKVDLDASHRSTATSEPSSTAPSGR
jgi:PIN domain nuclease of toxin-antitoxin system